MLGLLEQLQRTFRWADAADILFVSLFLYALLVWFKSTASRPILVGMIVVAAVYLTAKAFDMYLTASLFQAGLAVAAVAVIVVFQEDLRRAFVRVASIGRLTRRRGDNATPALDILVEVAFELAAKKVGSLVVLRGLESIDHHLSGGVVVDGQISKALLDSIFDPHSLGHDGAVILADGRVQKFGAHLPLSEDSKQIGNRGTRHCAALGLAERSDALVVVVSEERGVVSVAHNGTLQQVDSPVELKQILERFSRVDLPPTEDGLNRQILIQHSGLKLAAIIMAFVWWFMVSVEAESVQKTFLVPIDYRNLPDTLALDFDETRFTEARITLSGYERAFNLLAPSALRVSLDLSKLEEGRNQQLPIDESHIKLPSNLTLFRCAPRIVELSIEKWVRTPLKVEARIEHQGPDQRITLLPDTVPVLIWRSMKARTPVIETELIDLARVRQSTEIKAKLVLREYMRLEPDQPPEIIVKVDVATDRPNAEGG